MNESKTVGPAENQWSQTLTLVVLSAALLAFIDVVPMALDGAAAAIATVLIGGILLYYVGKVAGSMMATADTSE